MDERTNDWIRNEYLFKNLVATSFEDEIGGHGTCGHKNSRRMVVDGPRLPEGDVTGREGLVKNYIVAADLP